jgi:CRP-like cAMP-binding protein
MLSNQNQALFENFKHPRKFKKGEKLFDQSDLLNFVFCFREGLVKLETVGEQGKTVTVGFIKGGDSLGIGSVLSNQPVSYSATAIEDTQACTFKGEVFRQVLRDSPDLAIKYMTDLFKELRMIQGRLLSGVDKDVPARVAEALLYFVTNIPDHKFTRKELADWAGTTPESVIRTLGDFEKENLIAQIGRRVEIRDAARLKELAGIIV